MNLSDDEKFLRSMGIEATKFDESMPVKVNPGQARLQLILTAFEKFFERLTPDEQRIVERQIYRRLCQPPPDPQMNLFEGEES